MNEIKTFVESLGNFKVSKLASNGLTRIHAHDSRFTLGVVCNESCITGSVRTKDGNILYQTKLENQSSDVVRNKISELCNMYNRASAAFAEDVVKKSDVEKEDNDKKVLLDDTILTGVDEIKTDGKVIVDMGGRIVASNDGEKLDDELDAIIIEDPVTEPTEQTTNTAKDVGYEGSDIEEEPSETTADDASLETDAELDSVDDTAEESDETATEEEIEDKIENAAGAAGDFTEVKSQLVGLADVVAGLVNTFDDADADNKLIATGLSSQLYNIALDVESFVDQFTTKSDIEINDDIEETEESDESTDVEESLSVASKVDYIDMARGGINQARRALSSEPEKFGRIIEMLADLNSELVTQFK